MGIQSGSQLRVLHVWSTAGVGAALAHHNGHDCIMREKFDPYHQSKMYNSRFVTRSPVKDVWWFYAAAAWRSLRADLLHIHGGHRVAELMARLGKPYIIHYHGTDARHIRPEIRARAELGAKRILVSTQDLLRCVYAQEPIWCPNPVDTQFFAPRAIPQNGRGLTFVSADQDVEATKQRLDEFGYGDIEWDFRRRYSPQIKNSKKVKYRDMPDIMSQYEYYSDVKQNLETKRWYDTDSKTALEAMSLGLKVIRNDGSVSDTLQARHRLDNSAAMVMSIYEEVIGLK